MVLPSLSLPLYMLLLSIDTTHSSLYTLLFYSVRIADCCDFHKPYRFLVGLFVYYEMLYFKIQTT